MSQKIAFESEDKRIQVVDLDNGYRFLMMDGACMGVSVKEFPSSAVSEYALTMLDAVYMNLRGPKSALHIGGGPCLVPSSLGRLFGIDSEVLELEPQIPNIVRDYFDIHGRVRIVVGDAKSYLQDCFSILQTFGYIFLDAYTGDKEDDWFYSKEGLKFLSELMTKDTILTINWVEDINKAESNKKPLEEIFELVKSKVIRGNSNKVNTVYFLKKKEKVNGTATDSNSAKEKV